MTRATFALRDIDPNPFRHIERYPMKPEKIAALRASIQTTSFWDNLLARRAGGRAEIAYGHHRLEALRQEFGPTHEITLTIRSLDDAAMIKVMANENMEEWGATIQTIMNSVRTVVEAFAEGKIRLEPIDAKAKRARKAPFYSPAPCVEVENARFYSAETVSRFLGWTRRNGEADYKVELALGGLDLIEQGALSDADFETLNFRFAKALVEQTRAAYKGQELTARYFDKAAEKAAKSGDAPRQQKLEREAAQARERGRAMATKVGDRISKHLKDGGGVREARDIAASYKPPKSKVPPNIGEFRNKLMGQIDRILHPDFPGDPLTAKLDQLVEFRSYLHAFDRKDTAATLRKVGKRFHAYADQMETPTLKTVGPKRGEK